MNSVDRVYLDLLKDILENGVRKDDRTGTGTVSVFGRQLRFDMSEGFPLLTTKKIHTKSVIYELLWFLRGDTNTKYLNDNGVTIWDEWANENGELGPIYGKQWVDWGEIEVPVEKLFGYEYKKLGRGINQIQNAVDRLKSHPDCRRIMVNAWNVGDLDDMALMPCHYGFQLYTQELTLKEREELEFKKRLEESDSKFVSPGVWVTEPGPSHKSLDYLDIPKRKLSLMWNQRSVDVGLGLPFNIASYAFLLHMFAQQVNMIPHELIANLGDTHIYSNHIEQIKEQLGRDSEKYDSPKLKLQKAESIFDYRYEDFEIIGYENYPSIKMPIAI